MKFVFDYGTFLKKYSATPRHRRLGVFFLILFLGFCGIGLSACQSKPDAYDTQGRPIFFSQYHGKWLVINYWASWCKPCWEEMPELNTFAQRYASQAVVFGVNHDSVTGPKLQTLIQQMKITFPVLTSDPATRFNIGDIAGLPTTIIINPQGKKVKTLTGPQTVTELQHAIGVS